MRARTILAALLLVVVTGGAARAQWIGETGDSAGPPPVDYVLDSWRASGEAGESVCTFKGELAVRILGRGWVEMPLADASASLGSLTVTEGEADKVIVRAKDGKYSLLFGKRGSYKLKMELVVRVSKGEADRSVEIPLVPAVTSLTSLSIQAESVEFKTSPEVKASKAEGGATAKGAETVITIFGADVPKTVLTWKVKAKVEEGEALAFAESTLGVTATRGLVRVDDEIRYTVLRGKLARMRVQFPSDCSLQAVACDGLRGWETAPQGATATVLTVDLAAPAEKEARLKLTLERPVARVPAEVEVPGIEVLDVRRESGSVLISAEKGIKVESGTLEGASQVDVREATADSKARPDLAFKYLKRPCRVVISLSDVAAKVTASVQTRVQAGRERLQAVSTIGYQIRDAGVFRLRAQLDPGTQLVDVRGQNINNWRRTGDIVEVDLRSKAEDAYELVIETVRAVAETGPTQLPKLQMLDVERETGFIAICPRLDTKVESSTVEGIRQVDASELPEALKTGGEPVSLAYRYVQHPYRVDLLVGKVQPEVYAKVMNAYTVKEKELILDASVDLEVRKAGIFDLRLSFPPELRIEGTVRGSGEPAVEDWDVDRNANQLFLKFRSKVEGNYSLVFTAKAPIDKLLDGLDLPVIAVEAAKKESGYVSVRSDEPVRMKVDRAKSSSVSDLDIRELPPKMRVVGGKVDLAFEYYKAPWKLRLDMEEIKPVVSAEAFTLVSLGPGRENSSAQIDYTIEQAKVDEFIVQLPAESENVKWTGEQIRLKEPVKDSPGRWRITLHAGVEQSYTLYVTFERPMADQGAPAARGEEGSPRQTSAVTYVGVHPVGVSNERGYVAVTPEGNVEIRALQEKLSDVNVIDIKEVPAKFTKGLIIPIVWTFEYFKEKFSIGMEVIRHEDVPALVTVAEYGRLSTIVSDDGQMTTDLTLLLRNTREPYLRLILPEGAEIIHAFVAGEPVRPGKSAADLKGLGKVELKLIPIIGAGKSGEMFPVLVSYKHIGGSLGQRGGLALECPKVNIPILRLGWEVVLPVEYELAWSYGSLRLAAEGSSMQRLQAAVSSYGQTKAGDQEAMDNVAQRNLLVGQQGRRQEQAAATTADVIQRSRGYGREGVKFYFEKILAVRPSAGAEFVSPGSVKMRYSRTGWRKVLQGVLVLAVALGAWRIRNRPARRRYGALVGGGLVLLAVTVLSPGFFAAYVAVAMGMLWVAAGAMLLADACKAVGPAMKRWWNRPRGMRHTDGSLRFEPPAPAAGVQGAPGPSGGAPQPGRSAGGDEEGRGNE